MEHKCNKLDVKAIEKCEFNLKQVKKALECCFLICYCNTCPYYKIGEHTQVCTRKMAKDVLALIKELTEENERLHASCTELTQKCASLTEENERLRVVLKMNDAPFPEGLQIVHDFCEKGKRKAKADTVRKMQERLNKHFCHDLLFLEVDQRLIMDIIDQIAEEMLEEGR